MAVSKIDATADELQKLYTAEETDVPYIRIYTHKDNPQIPLGCRVIVTAVMEHWLPRPLPVRPKESVSVTV